MIFETYFKHVYLYVACLYATSGTGLYAQTLHQHAGTQRDTVPVTFPVQHLEEVVITAGRPGITAGAVSNRISSSEIHRAAGSSLATLLERISGVSSLSTGTTVSKPVIHGMHGNRILIINNGARQTGQQWATDHAPEVDINESGNILVIKGADGVRYGSDALGGIIVTEQPPFAFGQEHPKGRIATFYGSNGHRYAATGSLEGTLPFLRNIAWRMQGTYSNSGDRSTAHYLLNNTGTRGLHFSASAGYDSGRLRIEGIYSHFGEQTGVMFGAQMGSEDLLAERIRLGRPVYTDPFTRHISYPYQKVVHRTAIGKVRYNAGAAGVFYWQTSWQKDDRRENRIRRMNHSDIPAVALLLSSIQNTFRWKLDYGPWQTEIGGQMIFTDNHSKAGTGIVPVIPNYTEMQAGAYGIQKYRYERTAVEAGIRLDRQETRAGGYDWTGNYYGGNRKFCNFTYGLGGHYRLSKYWELTSNFALTWRAPHVHELYSNGNELGSGMFVRGDASMNAERSHKWITSVSYRDKVFHIRLDSYLQWIKGYIYDEPLKENITVISGTYPVFRYRQTPAFFRGADFDFRFMPAASWEYHLIASFIRANEQGTGNYLPYIPSFHLSHELAWTHQTKSHILFRLTARHKFVAKQNRFNPATDLIPYTPPAYHLFGAEASMECPVKYGNKLTLTVTAYNLLNREYKEYTNRSRYYAHDMGRDIRCTLNWNF